MIQAATAVVPAHNEQARLAHTLEALISIPAINHLIVVDDGSRDPTATIARNKGAEVLYSSQKREPAGKGRALLTGLARARLRDTGAVLIADADLGTSASRLIQLLETLDERSPATIAKFPPAKGAGFGLVKRFARRGISSRTGFYPAEPLSGQRALLAGVLDKIPGLAPGYGAEVGMTLDLLSAGVTPREVPVNLRHRATGKNFSGFAHRARQGFDILRALRGERIPW